MKAGFARVNINPSIGTRMTGFGTRDRTRGCEAIHDDLYVRALYLEHAGKEVLILAAQQLETDLLKAVDCPRAASRRCQASRAPFARTADRGAPRRT